MRFKSLRKVISFIATIATLLNSLGAPLTVLAQEVTPEPTPIDTSTPAPEATITSTEAPTDAPTPIEVATPTPEVIVTPTPEAADLVTPFPATTQPETQNTTNENTQSQAPPSENPTVTPSAIPEVPQEHGNLTTTTIENVDLSQVTQLNANVDGNSNITTDKADYNPTDVVLISGTGFTPHKAYTIEIVSTDQPPVDFKDQIKADEWGSIQYAYQLDGTMRPNYAIYVKTGEVVVATTTFTDPDPSGNLDQCANKGTTCDTAHSTQWQNGNLNENQATYYEGDSIPYRIRMDTLTAGSSGNTITIAWDTTKSAKHAIDYITTYNRTELSADPCAGVAGCGSGSFSATPYAIPVDPNVTGAGVTPIAGDFTLFGGTITAASPYALSDDNKCLADGDYTGDSTTCITLTFTANVTNPVLAWGGHIGNRADWGSANSAISIPGSPYHTRFIDLNGKGGNQDRSLAAAAVIYPAYITVTKDSIPNDAQDFLFTTTGTGLSSFSLDDDSDSTLSNTQVFTITSFASNNGDSKTITEGTQSGWSLTGLVCNDNNGSVDLATRTATLSVVEGETILCTFTNTLQQAHLTLVKTVTNNNGGTALASAWTLAATGPTNISGTTGGGSVTNAAVNQGTYSLSESGGPSGYSAGSWSCVKNAGQPVTGSSITLAPNDNATCTINNDDNAPSLTLVKTITNDNGGTAVVTDWTLTATGSAQTPTNLSGTTPVASGSGFKTDTYTLGENGGPSGYTSGTYSCVKNGGAPVVGNSVSLGLGDTATCTINNDDNAPQLHLRKTITNDNGGTAAITDWTLTATGALGSPTNLSGSTPVDSTASFKADTYSLGESGGPAGYAAGAWDCGQATMPDTTHVTVPLGANITCTINNDDIAPKLHLRKIVTNDNGGTATSANFTLTADGTGANDLSGTSPVDSGAGLKADTFALSETNPGGYLASAWVCSGGSQNGSNITLGLNQEATCTITNDDIAPSLTLIKEVSNNDGGNNAATEWTLTATGSAQTPTNLSGTTPEVSGADFQADTYILGENGGPSGYIAGTYSCVKNNGDPVVGNSISLALGDSATCTIINDDIPATITLNKVVVNTFGGTAVAGSFTLLVDGTGVTQGVTNDVDSNTSHTIGENSLTGYEFVSITGDALCPEVLGGNVTLDEGQNITCTITNHDVAAHLIVIKHVINDNGGSKVAADFSTTISGVSTATPTASGAESPGVDNTLTTVGSYSIDEGAHVGYTKTLSADCTGTIALGQTKTCTITNDDIAPQLTVIKHVITDNGGDAVAGDFTMNVTATNPSDASFSGAESPGTTITLNAGSYSVSELGPSGYSESDSQDCSGTIAVGESKTCTITNDDIAPILHLRKVVITDDGGDATTDDFTLTADGTESNDLSGTSPVDSDGTLQADTFALGETNLPGYSASEWVCDGGTQDGASITLGISEEATCTITNDDIPAKITLIKEVINRGGEAGPDDFGISVDGKVVTSGVANDVDSNTSHTIDEQGILGYDFVSITGDEGCPTELGGSVTLNEGEEITCTITNREILKSIKIEKSNNKSGGASAGDTVNYTLVVTNTGDVNIPNVVVTDVLPGGFSYISDTAQVNGVPQNPGISGSVLSWNIGTVTTENPVTITYQAKIASDVSDGTYTNFASCTETVLQNIEALVLFQPAVCETVHSDVPIGRGVSFGGNLGQVLGISTELPATGSPTGLALIALGLIGVGFILKKKYVKN